MQFLVVGFLSLALPYLTDAQTVLVQDGRPATRIVTTVNPDVFRIIAHCVDSIFKAYPDYHVISVSQNDGSKTYSTCPACKSIVEKKGEPSGSIIHFVNKMAKRFPNKEIAALAYRYSMRPPRHVKLLPHVNILLCNIDCRREVSLTDKASGGEFVRDGILVRDIRRGSLWMR